MNVVLVTQQLVSGPHGEQHNSLDQRWIPFLLACNVLPILLPNDLPAVKALFKTLNFSGILLTGGGEHDPKLHDKRSQVEAYLIEQSLTSNIPLVGVCRGMQALMQFHGAGLIPCSGQVKDCQTILFKGTGITVNSYHNFTIDRVPECFEMIAYTKDFEQNPPIVKAVTGINHSSLGIMWHPERADVFAPFDIAMFTQFLNSGSL